MKKSLFILLLFIAPFSYAQQDTLVTLTDSIPKPQIVEFKSYKMTVPDGWDIKKGCVENQCTMTSKRDTLLDFDVYIESINLTVNKLSNPNYTVDKYANYSIGYLPKVVQNFKVIERKKLRSNAYRVTYAGIKNGLEQTWRQYYYIKSQKVFIVTFSAETRKYEFYQPVIEPYLDSFKLK